MKKEEFKLRQEQKEKYKDMEIEDIIADIKTRTSCGTKQELINCAIWIKEESISHPKAKAMDIQNDRKKRKPNNRAT